MNVAIIEDHRILAEALNSALQVHPKIKEVRLFFGSDSFLKDQWQPDLIISDLLMPGIHGAELIKAYRSKLGEDIKIIVLSSLTDKTAIKNVIQNGAKSYLSKEESIETLIRAIHGVIEGEGYISESIQNVLNDTTDQVNRSSYHLSPRELEVLHLVCSGRIMKEVADDLGLSIHTAQSYHNNIMRKFKVRRTSDLIVAAIRHGFYNP